VHPIKISPHLCTCLQSHKIIIITAPSGAGKTSITQTLLKTFPDKLAFSISAATTTKKKL
jgi:guanylate kinase